MRFKRTSFVCALILGVAIADDAELPRQAWDTYVVVDPHTFKVVRVYPFSLFYIHQPFKMNFVWAGLCLVGAVFFMFR